MSSPVTAGTTGCGLHGNTSGLFRDVRDDADVIEMRQGGTGWRQEPEGIEDIVGRVHIGAASDDGAIDAPRHFYSGVPFGE